MFIRRRRVSDAIDYPNFELRPRNKKGGPLRITWATVAVLGVIIGAVFAVKAGPNPFSLVPAIHQVQQLYSWFDNPRPEAKVLVVTANRK